MRLLPDEMYSPRLAEHLRARGHDVLAVAELAELIGRSDIEVARFAREQGRIVVTENVADFLRLDAGHHPGLLLVSARRWPRRPHDLPRLERALAAWLDARPEDADDQVPDAGLVDWLQEPGCRSTSAGQCRPLKDLLAVPGHVPLSR